MNEIIIPIRIQIQLDVSGQAVQQQGSGAGGQGSVTATSGAEALAEDPKGPRAERDVKKKRGYAPREKAASATSDPKLRIKLWQLNHVRKHKKKLPPLTMEEMLRRMEMGEKLTVDA